VKQLEFVNFIQVAITSASIFAAVLLVSRRNTRALALLLAVFGLHMAFNFAEETGLLLNGPLITPALSLLYGPLLYLLIRGLILHDGFLRGGDFIHFLPFLLALFLTQWLTLIRIATVASLVIYSIACLRNIWLYHRATRLHRSDAAALRMNWVVAVFAGFGLLTVLDVVRMLTVAHQSPGFQQASYAISLSMIAILFGVLAYYAINRPLYFEGLTPEEFLFTQVETAASCEATGEDAKAFAAIEAMIKTSQLHRQAHLTLLDVALQTPYSEREVSRLINVVGRKNFCDYINALRVADVAEMLSGDSTGERSILEHAFDSGFTSKSTFNSAFKKQMGVTPSAYRQNTAQS